MRSQKPNRKKNKSFFSWLSKGSYQCYPVSHWVDNSEQTKGCWILIFFLKSWLRRGKQMALRLKTIISLPLHSRAFPPPPLPMADSEIHGLLKFYVWCWELNLEALSCTSSSASLCFKHEAMIWSSRPLLCIHRTQWKATKTPVETTPLRELMWEGWGRCTRGENGQARITACEELGGGRDRTKEAGMADSWKASFILATAVWDTWVPFFFPKRKFREAQRADASITGTVWLGGLWPRDVLLWGLCFSLGAQEEKQRGEVPLLTVTAGEWFCELSQMQQKPVSKTAREAGSSAAPWPPAEDVVLCHLLLAWNFHPSIFAAPVSTHTESRGS